MTFRCAIGHSVEISIYEFVADRHVFLSKNLFVLFVSTDVVPPFVPWLSRRVKRRVVFAFDERAISALRSRGFFERAPAYLLITAFPRGHFSRCRARGHSGSRRAASFSHCQSKERNAERRNRWFSSSTSRASLLTAASFSPSLDSLSLTEDFLRLLLLLLLLPPPRRLFVPSLFPRPFSPAPLLPCANLPASGSARAAENRAASPPEQQTGSARASVAPSRG